MFRTLRVDSDLENILLRYFIEIRKNNESRRASEARRRGNGEAVRDSFKAKFYDKDVDVTDKQFLEYVGKSIAKRSESRVSRNNSGKSIRYP